MTHIKKSLTNNVYLFKNLIFFYLINSILFNTLKINVFAKPNSLKDLMYNTSSGIYKAKIVRVDNFNKKQPSYVHKLISVPYGEKPERFQPSQIKKYENGIHEKQEPVFCYQPANISAYGFFSLNEVPEMSEDCLKVNIYIPVSDTVHLENLPVIVHIHGGSNMVGGAALFDGSILASYGKVIVAVINFRLSILGFLSDMTKKYPGNYGLRDQILAIKWIKQNCYILNCDPNAITLWGHSAGAGNVNWLAISPLSNHLFQRVVIQSGTSFSYWGYDKMPFDRYKALKTYFNCSNLPDAHTNENGAMTQLIDKCLINVSLNELFGFRFSLIDAPGPVYDGFLGNDSLINGFTPHEMISKDNSILNLDILVGINAVEGFSFEGYFSSSVKFWAQNNFTNEMTLTLERLSLLTREKCKQNSLIANRILIDDYYENKIKSIVSNKNNLDKDEVKQLKSIFLNGDIIFDSGFIELLRLLYDENEVSKKKLNLFVYEYLHENTGSESTLNKFKQYLKNNYSLSTHFDGIDLAFGLPLAYQKQIYFNEMDVPFSEFGLDNTFTENDLDFSLIIMTYLTNFVKNGNPNVGDKVNKIWKPYTQNKSYLKLNSNLISKMNNHESQTEITTGIRDDLYDFWHVDMKKNGDCNAKSNVDYISKYHTKNSQNYQPALDKCFEKLNESIEYIYLREMFLIEYETCMNSAGHDSALKNLFNTFCFDVIIIRRLLIEYDVCCNKNSTEITSTICSLKNFDPTLKNFTIANLIDYARSKSRMLVKKNDQVLINFKIIYHFICVSISIFNYFFVINF